MEPRGVREPLLTCKRARPGKASFARTLTERREHLDDSRFRPGKRRRTSLLTAALALALGAAVSSETCRGLSDAWLFPQTARREERAAAPSRLEPGRREAAALLAASVVGLSEIGSADAESSIDMIVASGRATAAREAREGGFLGANKFKKDMGNYNITNIQEFLPNLYLSKKSFQIQLKQLDNKKFDLGNPEAWGVLRSINRDEPNRKIRKELFRCQLWVKDKNRNKPNIADLEYERIKRALDEADTQFLLLSRLEEGVSNAAIRQAKRNLQAIIDGIDELLALIPKDELEAAKAVADTKKVKTAKLPLKTKKSKLDNATNATDGSNSTVSTSSEGSPVKKSTPSGVAVADSSVPFSSMAMDSKD
eukprot:TRINITY_DN95044_c0_g1_i1.p1 TRINITY_DN95044_c0_g1~~TRINITY_DN95044_c0_g1_i1.p1  ORF type:complete len:384 (-),score=89.38 TRINITY_DN95044_c0_g1_i1:29-1126(-)